MSILKNLEPKRVFHYFQEISQIPRCTYDEEKISDYIKSVGERLGLETIQDDTLNVIIRKSATPGYENSPGVIIQGHMDMVCEKESNSDHDFKKGPIKLIVDGDYIKADKTTLGADNGIAVAMGLALLEDNTLEHPNIELLVTSSEEVEMDGAFGLSKDVLKGTRLINVDTEEEGVLVTGSAGGELVEVEIPIEYEEVKDLIGFIIEVKGLKGGHSGMEIHKARGNSNKIINEILKSIREIVDLKLISMEGGTKDNAIPRSSRVQIGIKSSELSLFTDKFEEIKDNIIQQNKKKEPNIDIIIEKAEEVSNCLTSDVLNSLVLLLENLPTGVFTMIPGNENIVESSSNLAIVNTGKDKITIQISTRSSSEKPLLELREKIIGQVKKINGKYTIGNAYPHWEYNPESELRNIALNVYRKKFNKEMERTVIHAGLECGVLAEKYPNLDIISIGPDMEDVHTPGEKVSISSVRRVYDYLIELLKELK